MVKVMNYPQSEADWAKSADQIMTAFGSTASCVFIDKTGFPHRTLVPKNEFKSCEVNLSGGASLRVLYSTTSLYFSYTSATSSFALSLNNDGTLARVNSQRGDGEVFARALFFLDLLTPEVEQAIEFPISGHQKMEWALSNPLRI